MTDFPIPTPAPTTLVEQARDLSFQARAHQEGRSGMPLIMYLASGGGILSPWWSTQRDLELRDFWKRSDHLSGALYNMIAKMTAIPFRIVPKDPSNYGDVLEAEEEQMKLTAAAEYGEGWVAFYSKFIEDLLSADNGAFAEVIGAGPRDGPIYGRPISVAHLDSGRCQRTGNPEYPVIYHDLDGRLYKLHYTRVIYASQMPSPRAEMYGVGFSAVSRCVYTAQNLVDIATYKMEKLGSRPHRGVGITKGGLDPEDMRTAFQIANSELDSLGLSRYSKLVIVGNATIPEAGFELIDLAKLPDGFKEEEAIVYGMATIALAFGVDARELFPAMSAGATRADALLQHLKQRGKGPGQIIQMTETQFNYKFLPSHLKMAYDFQDDAEDQQAAEIRHVRAQSRQRNLVDRATTPRVEREKMVEDGEINRRQFELMELSDGRLADGAPLLSLFYSPLAKAKKYLALEGVENPLDTNANAPEFVLSKVAEAETEVFKALGASPSDPDLLRFYYALEALANLYRPLLMPLDPTGEGIGSRDNVEGALRTYPDRQTGALSSGNPARTNDPRRSLTEPEE